MGILNINKLRSRTLVLHVGMHKTGSTAIQASLSSSREFLLSQGVNYLDKVRMNHSTTFVSLFGEEPHKYHINIQNGINTPEKAMAHNKELESLVKNEFAKNKSRTFVVSGEGLSILPDEGVNKLKDFVRPYFSKIQVVFYVRRPIDFYNSMFQQYVAGGRTFEQLKIEPPMPDYRFRLEKFLNIFGDKCVTVRLFDRKRLLGEDIVFDFLKTIGLDEVAIERVDRTQTNEGLSSSAVNLLNLINQRHPVFSDGSVNEGRGGFIRKAFSEASIISSDKKFNAPCFYKKEHVEKINKDVFWVNQYLSDASKLDGLSYDELRRHDEGEACGGVSFDYVVELINELQKISDRRMNRINNLERIVAESIRKH